MENQELTLHQQKVTILSRLIKETSLTLEEALLLLKEEEVEAPEITVAPSTGTWKTFGPATSPNIVPGSPYWYGTTTNTPILTTSVTIPSGDAVSVNN